MNTTFNLYEIITQKIIDSLEAGVIPWQKPWKGGCQPMNLKTGHKYKGINYILLALGDFDTPYFLTFNQIRELGGKLKSGSQGNMIIYWNIKEKKVNEETIETYPIIQYYYVFNVTQTEGIEYESKFTQINNFNVIPTCEEIVLKYKDCPKIEHKHQKAFYRNSEDLINMPIKKSFNTEGDYYKTLFHEMIHSTGHKTRLNRDLPAVLNSKSEYSKEELIAEMGANFLCGQANLSNNMIQNSASYIDYWLKQLKEDKKFIFSVASQSQKAVEYILEQTIPK